MTQLFAGLILVGVFHAGFALGRKWDRDTHIDVAENTISENTLLRLRENDKLHMEKDMDVIYTSVAIPRNEFFMQVERMN